MPVPMLDTEKALRLQNARLSALHDVTIWLTSAMDMTEVLQRVVEMAPTDAGAHYALGDALRITVGMPEENAAVLSALRSAGTAAGAHCSRSCSSIARSASAPT